MTDAEGVARFTTIFPGCYRNRWPHFHFEVFRSLDAMATGRDSILIGQSSFDRADCADVYAKDPAYRASARNLPRNDPATDIVFRGDSAEQMAQRTVRITRGQTFTGRVTIGL